MFASSCFHPASWRRSYFGYQERASPGRGLPPLRPRLLSGALGRLYAAEWVGGSCKSLNLGRNNKFAEPYLKGCHKQNSKHEIRNPKQVKNSIFKCLNRFRILIILLFGFVSVSIFEFRISMLSIQATYSRSGNGSISGTRHYPLPPAFASRSRRSDQKDEEQKLHAPTK